MKLIICRKDFELTGDVAADRRRYRRGHVIDCLADGAEPGAAVDANPFMQVLEVPDLSSQEAERLCMTEYGAWLATLDETYFSNSDDPRRRFDDPSLYARRFRRLDIDAVGLRQTLKSALAADADRRARLTAVEAELTAIVVKDERATRVSK